MRLLALPIIVLLAGCTTAPLKKHTPVPSTVGIRGSLTTIKTHVDTASTANAQASSHVDNAIKLSNQLNAILDSLSK